MIIDLLNMIFTGLTALAAILALIFGFFYFNKRLKIYHYIDNHTLKIICFDKGNGACKIKKLIYTVNNKSFEESNISDNECTISLSYCNYREKIRIKIFDNFGRVYKLYVNVGK